MLNHPIHVIIDTINLIFCKLQSLIAGEIKLKLSHTIPINFKQIENATIK